MMTDEDYANGDGGMEETPVIGDLAADSPLLIHVRDGVLEIRVGINVLAYALSQNPENGFTNHGRYYKFKATDPQAFSEGVANALMQEDEVGNNKVVLMLDSAMWTAVENDCGVKEVVDTLP